jgi:succinate-acetate transporter protein
MTAMAVTDVPPAHSTPAVVAPVFGAGIADPGPLGLAAFALTTFVLSVFNAGLLPASAAGIFWGLALFYGGIVQVFAGMWEFVKGNTFGALAFSSYGAFWLSLYYFRAQVDLSAVLPAAASADDQKKALGVFLLGWTIFTLYMLVCTLRLNGMLIVVFGLLTLAFAALTLGDLLINPNFTKAGGWLGLATAIAAWYGSFAGVINASWKRVVLPVFPR